MTKKYGKVKNEAKLEEAIVSREIAKTVMDYGVSQYQIKKIIYLLALELEDIELSRDLVTVVNSVLDTDNNDKEEIIVR